MTSKYKFLAIDIDGTLIGPDQIVPEETREAIAAADRAGLRICLATGRSLKESLPIWRQLPLRAPFEPMVTIGGAMVCEPDTGRTLYQRTIPREIAMDFCDDLMREGYPAMAFVDGWRHGVDYFCAENGHAEEAHRLWFAKMDVRIRRVHRLRDAPDLPAPARISTVAPPEAADGLAQRLSERFRGRLTVHAILAPNYHVTIVEAFSPEADKFRAVVYLAQSRRVPASAIAVVGDDVNDLPMIRGAGLGVTLPHGRPAVLREADHLAADGLAAFIRQLVAGRFDGE
jgi:5-amino-6-(5-phospho-D-ribitylamino)uracil phosphatase